MSLLFRVENSYKRQHDLAADTPGAKEKYYFGIDTLPAEWHNTEMRVALFQLDGRLPNIALGRISAYHKKHGDDVEFFSCRRPDRISRTLFDDWDRIYASLIFTKTRPVAEALLQSFPHAVIGGTGWDLGKPAPDRTTVESIGIASQVIDYSHWPAFSASIGFTQRGCRFNCWFCDVPVKEGKVRKNATISDIWRGHPHPREILLLDNDFFGQAEWRNRIDELRAGHFKVSFNQGINVRCLSDEHCAAIASVNYQNDSFKRKGLYLAWDDTADEKTVFRGLRALEKYGVKPDSITVYMLIGAGEPESDREYRRAKLREFGARPYPMPYIRNEETRGFQRYVVRRYDVGSHRIPLEVFAANGYRPERC